MKISVHLLLPAMIWALASSGHAQTYQVYTSLQDFENATQSLTVFDFESIPAGTNCESFDFGDFTTQGTALYNVEISNENSHELYFNTSSYTQDLTVAFKTDQIAFGFDWRNTDNNDDMVRVDFNGTQYVLGAKDESGFWGVVASGGVIAAQTPFQFGDTAGGSGWTEGNLDNFRFTAVPELSSLWLWTLGCGVSLLGIRGRTGRKSRPGSSC